MVRHKGSKLTILNFYFIPIILLSCNKMKITRFLYNKRKMPVDVISSTVFFYLVNLKVYYENFYAKTFYDNYNQN